MSLKDIELTLRDEAAFGRSARERREGTFAAAPRDPTEPEMAAESVKAPPSNPMSCEPWSAPPKADLPVSHRKADLGIPER